jgi:hypothetical protein
MDARLGLEPRLKASKASVLPLDDRAIRSHIIAKGLAVSYPAVLTAPFLVLLIRLYFP